MFKKHRDLFLCLGAGVILIGFFIGLAAVRTKITNNYQHLRDQQPCSDFANESIKDVPFRCFKNYN